MSIFLKSIFFSFFNLCVPVIFSLLKLFLVFNIFTLLFEFSLSANSKKITSQILKIKIMKMRKKKRKENRLKLKFVRTIYSYYRDKTRKGNEKQNF